MICLGLSCPLVFSQKKKKNHPQEKYFIQPIKKLGGGPRVPRTSAQIAIAIAASPPIPYSAAIEQGLFATTVFIMVSRFCDGRFVSV